MLQIASDESEEFPRAAEALRENIFVDDFLASYSTADEAAEVLQQLDAALQRHGFRAHKWLSNDAEVLKAIPERYSVMKMKSEKSLFDGVKALGVHYNHLTDTLHYRLKQVISNELSKREVLRTIMQYYDMCGIFEPIKLQLKLLMQRIHLQMIGWDDIIPQDIAVDWNKLKEQLPAVESLTLERCVNFNEKAQIIIYADGSEEAYGAVAYVRNLDDERYPKTSLLLAKSRVAPIKQPLTIPQLELMGAVLASELWLKIKEAFRLRDESQVYVFLDSMVVLAWLQSGDPEVKLKRFVANRVKLIQKRLPKERLFYTSSATNSADKVTHGQMPKSLMEDKLWWQGPAYLTEATWVPKYVKFASDEEARKEAKIVANVAQVEDDVHAVGELIKRTSSWIKMRRVVARCMRWKTKLFGELTAKEIEAAENCIARAAQREFAEEIEIIKKGKSSPGVLSSVSRRSYEMDYCEYVGGCKMLSTCRTTNVIIF